MNIGDTLATRRTHSSLAEETQNLESVYLLLDQIDAFHFEAQVF
jgi:hypothetical protein